MSQFQVGMKLWYIVHPDYQKDVEKAAKDFMAENFKTKKGTFKAKYKKFFQDLNQIDDCCTNPFKHKCLIPGPEFLDANKIPYEIIVTKPGDILFINAGAYHFGACLTDPCINVAANFVNDQWVEMAQDPTNHVLDPKKRSDGSNDSVEEDEAEPRSKKAKDQYYYINPCGCKYKHDSMTFRMMPPFFSQNDV